MPDCLMDYADEDLIRLLREEWDEQAGGDDPFAEPTPAPQDETIYEVQPVVDSLGVVRILLTVEKHIGFEVPPCIIRRGGYSSFEDMIADLLPKIRTLQKKHSTKAE